MHAQQEQRCADHHWQHCSVVDVLEGSICISDESYAQHKSATAQLKQQVETVANSTAQKGYAKHKDKDPEAMDAG